jgi:hypothetical protein
LRSGRGAAATLAAIGCFLFLAAGGPIAAAENLGEERFERQVRPLLVAHCGRCHLQQARSKSGLELTSREALLRGGRRGPAIVPGDPESSLLVQAVRRAGELKMPPAAPLPDDAVAVLVEWIRDGAVWTSSPNAAEHGSPNGTEGRFWGLEPLRDPGTPLVVDAQWVRNEIDYFVLAEMERASMQPAPPADKLTLLRRVTFDLTGLPPTPAECRAFLADDSAEASVRVVDRLLASPAYGERWGRHWLDVVRFAETNGFEDDTEKANAYRYRDYVIRAFNDDLPYDRFVREQLAGDLLPDRRVSADGGHLESPIGSGFWWFGEILPLPFCPIEAKGVQANELESQIDVYGKAFLGVTLACARCHDHKFDPIVGHDYYAVAGTLLSTTNVQASLETPARSQAIETQHARVVEGARQIAELWERPEVQHHVQQARLAAAGRVAESFLAAFQLLSGETNVEASESSLQSERWRQLLSQAVERPDPIVYPLARLLGAPADTFARRVDTLLAKLVRMNAVQPQPGTLLADFESASYGQWRTVGHAFGDGPMKLDRAAPTGVVGRGYASSGRGGTGLVGRLTSPRFRVPGDRHFLCFSVCGGDYRGQTCVNLVLHSQASPEQADLYSATGGGRNGLMFRSFNLQYYVGQEVCIDVVDNHSGEDGYIAVDQVFLADHAMPVGYQASNPLVIARLAGAKSIDEVAARWQALIGECLERGALESADAANADWRNLYCWLTGPESPLLSQEELEALLPAATRVELQNLHEEVQRAEQGYPETVVALVSADRAEGQNASIHIGGDATLAGEQVPRGWPYRFAGTPAPATPSGSGRMQLAEWTASRENPLVARVIVNRLWQHHFGRGLVRSVDNFGRLGEPPTHPELLDFLARRLWVEQGSLKALHRLMLLSATYQQSSRPHPESLQRDPENRLLHSMNVRRLEAECIRDAILTVASRLDRQMYGPSIKLRVKHKYMLEPIETPGVEPPDCRRSLYLEARRNHAPTLLEAFDFPKRATTTGERAESSVPEQALVMLNSKFVAVQCQAWADKLLAVPAGDDERIAEMYWTALGRAPLEAEVTAARRFRQEQQANLRNQLADAEARRQSWVALCHVLFNVSEFIFVR